MYPKKTDDFQLIFTSDQRQPTDEILKIVENDPDFFTWKKQILSPTKVRWVGCDALNNTIQAKRFFNSDQIGVSIERHRWVKQPLQLFVGDKVIINRNNYDLGIFNGETGIVTEVIPYGNITVDFGDRIVTIPTEILTCYRGKWMTYNPQRDIDLAYVITVHKAQGSEYEEVVYVLDKTVIFNQSRKNLYTAITRAKKKVTIITDQRSLTYSLSHKTGMYNR
jgi:exodeoxyribonuclease V alpha subunit